MIALDVLTTVSIGLLVGTEFAVSAFVNPILARLDTGTRMQAISYFAKRLGTAMPFWYVGSAVLLLAEAIFRRHDNGEELILTAFALWMGVIVLTSIFLVPINNRMMQLDPALSDVSAFREHRRWDLLHRGRIAILTISMACFLVAVLR
jgi:uncharacterized membrane protein